MCVVKVDKDGSAKRRIQVTRHNFCVRAVKVLIFSTFYLQSCKDENIFVLLDDPSNIRVFFFEESVKYTTF